MDFTLGKLAEAKIFSRIDCNSAFWQRKLSEDSRLLTIFITPFGQFCFSHLPYGISTGTEQFQKVMTDLLGDIDGVEVQIDDVLVHSKDQAQHNNRLNQVFNRLTESKITLNKVKCEFSVSKVKVSGHILSSEGIAADTEKIEAIRNLASPRNVAEVRSFLGMVNHVSKFADCLASKTKPLRELLKKKNTWVWGQSQDQASTEIKEALTTAPILALYDPNMETKVNANASSYGIGGVVIKAVTSCSTHKIDQQETDGKNSKIRQSRS